MIGNALLNLLHMPRARRKTTEKPVHDSWLHGDGAAFAAQSNDDNLIREYMYESYEQTTVYVYNADGSDSIAVDYDKLLARKLTATGRPSQRTTTFHCCRPNEKCTKAPLHTKDVAQVISHMRQCHVTFAYKCILCYRSFATARNRAIHLNWCAGMRKAATYAQQDIDDEVNADNDVNDLNMDTQPDEDGVVELPATDNDDNVIAQPVITTREPVTPLLHTKNLTFWQRVDNNQMSSWMPWSCDKYKAGIVSACNVNKRGFYIRWCYDVNDMFLLRVPRYECNTHNIYFSGLNECVSTALSSAVGTFKSINVVRFDRTVMTHDLYDSIASDMLVMLNIKCVTNALKHKYKRKYNAMMSLHLLQPFDIPGQTHTINEHSQCISPICYGLAERPQATAVELVRQHTVRVQHALNVNIVRQLFQLHIVPYAVQPLATAHLNDVIDIHCKSNISMDNTFKFAEIGKYTDIDIPVTVEQAEATLDDDLMSDDDSVADNPYRVNKPTSSNEQSNSDNDTNTLQTHPLDIPNLPLSLNTLDDHLTAPVSQPGDNPNNHNDNDTVADLDMTNGARPERVKRSYNKKLEFSRLNAQLLTVVDSAGLLLQCIFVPNGEAKYQELVVRSLVRRQKEAVNAGKRVAIFNVISVDNASQSCTKLSEAYRAEAGYHTRPYILQDLWHARERYMRELERSHPSYKQAKQTGRKLIANLLSGQYHRKDDLRRAWINWAQYYSEPQQHSAISEMADIFDARHLLISNDQQDQVATVEKMLELYNRQRGTAPIDNNGTIVTAVLRKPGVTAINNLVAEQNIHFVYNRHAVPECQITKGTTGNENAHHLLRGRMTRFGGLRTITTGQQYADIIQYQLNYSKTNPNVPQYYVPIQQLPTNITCLSKLPPLPVTADELLACSQLELKNQSATWTTEQEALLIQKCQELLLTQDYCHTMSVWQWLSGIGPLAGKTPDQLHEKFDQICQQRALEQSRATSRYIAN